MNRDSRHVRRSARKVGALVLVPLALLAVGCGQQVAGSAVAAADATGVSTTPKPTASRLPRPSSSSTASSGTRPSASADDLAALAGVWEGQYTCAQGATGLKLTIDPPSGSTVSAVFEFSPLPGSPPVAKAGSYRMRGGLTSGRLVLVQQQWINQPDGYQMVDLATTSPITGNPSELSGRILGSGCTEFSVRRQ